MGKGSVLFNRKFDHAPVSIRATQIGLGLFIYFSVLLSLEGGPKNGGGYT